MANIDSTVKYLDLTGLLAYDALIKAYSDAGDTALANRLEAAIGEGGNVAEQIAAAINALKGTLDDSDAATIAAINDELNGIDTALETLNGSDSTAGSVAKAVKDGIDALDGGTISITSKQPVTSVSQANGLVSASSGNIDAQYVDVTDTDNNFTATTVEGVLSEIATTISNNATAGQVKVFNGNTEVSAIAADGNTYTIKLGTDTVATINIARDMVVSSGSVVSYSAAEISALTDVPTGTTLVADKKYVKLVIANSTDGKNIYIAVDDLYDDYTFTDGDEIDFTETNNEVTATIKTGSIAKTKLTTALQNEITSARTTITEITQTDPATKHILVTKTAGTGATPDNYVISENDIASAAGLSAEVTRAQNAEGEFATAIGTTGVEGSRTYTSNVTLDSGVTKNVKNDINKLDARVGAAETFISNLTAISSLEIAALFTTNTGE